MKYLLDTHTVLWMIGDSPLLPADVRERLTESGHTFYVSAASAWELATKHRLGKLPEAAGLVAHFEEEIARTGALLLPVHAAHGIAAGSFPQEHKDPFDRILAAQAVLEDLVLLSRDAKLDIFGVRRVW